MKQSIVSAAALLCAGCALGAPTGVRVKTAPTIHVPVSRGGATTTLEDYLSTDILNKLLGNYADSDAKIYQYVPEDDKSTLHLLVRYPLMHEEIPPKEDLEEYGNLKNYLEEMGIIEKNVSPDTEISIDISNETKIAPIKDIDLSGFKTVLPKNMGFKSITAKIYAGPKDLRYKLYGNISADYWQEYNEQSSNTGKQTLQILGETNSPYMYFEGNLSAFSKNQLISAEATDYALRTPSLQIELRDILSPPPERLDFYFNVAPQVGDDDGKITFKVKDIEGMESLQLYVDMTLDISLAFVVLPPAESAVIQLTDIPGINTDSEQDIFGRTKTGDFFEGVQTVTLRLHYDNSLMGSDAAAKMRVDSEDVCDFALKTGKNQTSEAVLDADYVRTHLLYPEDMELAFIPDKDGTLFSFGPGKYGEGGSFALTGVEVETALDHTFLF